MKYLITGHNGFKGSWLSLMLTRGSCELFGLSLAPEQLSHFRKAKLSDLYAKEFICDIRNKDEVKKIIDEVAPEVIIHMAAQPLVIQGYKNPYETFSVNVIGTLNVLEAASSCASNPFVLVVTTDKVYRNRSEGRPFREGDCLGGSDPYSASKSMADLLSQSWSMNDPKSRVDIARAGNVIGGGDYSENRLFPDLIKSLRSDEPIKLRNPNAVRPWQHVLDCLNGYLKLIDRGLNGNLETAWNFGPDPEGYRTVNEVAETFIKCTKPQEVLTVEPSVHEEAFLTLDSTKAKVELDWQNKLSFADAIKWTTEWFKADIAGNEMREISEDQVKDYFAL